LQSITYDEYGRPYIILKEQQRQARLQGIQASKVPAHLLSKWQPPHLLTPAPLFRRTSWPAAW